jgi:uncharacterized protein YdcH (DUF465 family)
LNAVGPSVTNREWLSSLKNPPGQILIPVSEPDSAWSLSKGASLMENHTQEDLKAHLLSTNEHFRNLHEQHARLKKDIQAIESKPYVSEADELEEQRLKKLKLHIKDQMNEIITQYKHASVG